jgi:hypothetical protein
MQVHNAFHWDLEHGSTAYNHTLKNLRRKLDNLWSLHYRSRSRRVLAGGLDGAGAGGGSSPGGLWGSLVEWWRWAQI